MSSTESEKINFAAAAIERTDGELLLACRGGDETAWLALVERFEKLVATVPRRAGLDEDLTADVFQEVFTTLFEKMHDIEQPERIRAWLVTTAKFKTWRIISQQKSNRKSTLTLDDDEQNFPEIADESPLTDEILIQIEQQQIVRTAVASLDERCRQMLTMLYLRETPATYAEVAGQIGVGETSVSPLRARCLKKMIKILQ